jgi:hypothetical protein
MQCCDRSRCDNCTRQLQYASRCTYAIALRPQLCDIQILLLLSLLLLQRVSGRMT